MRSKFKWIFTLLIALTMQFSFAQEKTITGMVSDAKGPLAGANVVIKGTKKAVTTGFDGKFSIKAKEGEQLLFSFIGMNDVVRTVGSSNVINIVLQEEPKQIGEVFVTAMGIKKRQDEIVSSNQVVKTKEITQAANPNVVQSLIGKVSGLQINTTSNGVNSTTRIVSRGNRSITGDNQMLVVVDNVISSAQFLQQLPPELIDNVNVVKGPQGAALYGELGSNGVIIVSTKRGSKDEKFSASFNSAIDFESVAYLPKRQDKYGQGWDGHIYPEENGSWGEPFDGSIQAVGLPQADGTQFYAPYSNITDNIKGFFKTGLVTQNGLSLSIGGDQGYANFSYGRQTTDFMVDGDRLKRNTFILKAGKQFGKFRIEGNFNFIGQDVEQTNPGLYQELLQTPTNVPIELFENSGNDEHWTIYYRSPYWRKNNERFFDLSNTFNAVATLNYRFNKNIGITYTANLRTIGQRTKSYKNEFKGSQTYLDNGGGNVVSEYYNSNGLTRNFYGDLIVDLNYKLTEDLSFKANIGNNITDNTYNVMQQGGKRLDIPGYYHINNVLSPNTPSTLANFDSNLRKVAFFGNFDFGYKDYLFLNATFRREMSSVLSKRVGDYVSNKWFNYPSVGVSFIPTKAFDLGEKSFMNYAKVTANYAMTGNTSAVAAFGVDNVMVLGNGYPFATNSSYIPNKNPVSEDIQPEIVHTYELSTNLGFFKDRITLGASAYHSKTQDLITYSPLSATTGLSSFQGNIGRMHTDGFEVDLGLAPIRSANGFNWNFRVSYTTFKTIIDELKQGVDELPLLSNNTVGIFAKVGEQFPTIKGTTYSRDPQGRVIIDSKTGLPLRDSNFSVLGKVTPDYVLGLTNVFEYKGLKLITVLDYRTGHQFYSDVKRELAWSGRLEESAEFDRNVGFIFPNSVINTGTTANPVYVENTSVYTGGSHPAPNGNNTPYTNTISYYSGNYDRTAENLVLDATALKIREISLSYSLPEKILKGTGLTSLRFGVNARNPFVILAKDNKGYADPETSLNNGNAGGFANLGQYPASRTFGGSINLTF